MPSRVTRFFILGTNWVASSRSCRQLVKVIAGLSEGYSYEAHHVTLSLLQHISANMLCSLVANSWPSSWSHYDMYICYIVWSRFGGWRLNFPDAKGLVCCAIIILHEPFVSKVGLANIKPFFLIIIPWSLKGFEDLKKVCGQLYPPRVLLKSPRPAIWPCHSYC